MKNSKTTVAAAILSFTLVGASSAFALGAGTGSPAANPAQAPVEVVEVVTPATPAATPATPADVVEAVTPPANPVSPAEAVDVVSSAPAAAAPVAVAPEVSNEKSDRGEFGEPNDSDVVSNDSNISADQDHQASNVGNGSDPAEAPELPTPADTPDTQAVTPAATTAG